MTSDGDDTTFDALAAQVRRAQRLNAEQLAERIDEARNAAAADARSAATAQIVESFLAFTLDEAVARRDRGVEVAVLYQEGAIAVAGAVAASLEDSTEPADLVRRVGRDVQAHLDAVVAAESELRGADEAILGDVRLLSALRTRMRADKGEEPTVEEMAAVLKWPKERVETLFGMLTKAQAEHDLDILEYLDDA